MGGVGSLPRVLLGQPRQAGHTYPAPCSPVATGDHDSLTRLVKETISKNRGGGDRLWRSLECLRAAGH
jgi:hypothetical protein